MTQHPFRRLAAAFSLIAMCAFPAEAQQSPMQMRPAANGDRAPAAPPAGSNEIDANDNRTPAGRLEGDVLTLALEIRTGVWHAEAEDGPPLYVQAFGEKGKPAQIPGPLLRVPTGTPVHVTITNTLNTPATVFGFMARPATSDPGVEIAPNQTREMTFLAGAPGTYFYWARTVTPNHKNRFVGNQPFALPFKADAQLNGAFIVDGPGPVPTDRIFVINMMEADADILHGMFNVATINGKDYPFTEPLRYSMGDTIRWRVVNASVIDHAMHLHGAFYRVLSLGDVDKDTHYTADEQQTVVTEDIPAGGTMLMEWTPSHPGRWLFHCHYSAHTFTDNRVPMYGRRIASVHAAPARVAGTALPPDPKDAMADMAGLVMGITVLPRSGAPLEPLARNPHKIELDLQSAPSTGTLQRISCSIRDGSRVETSQERSAGPPLILTKDQPVEITVVNGLDEPTTIHWHGLELDSYYDGVMGAGLGEHVTPAIAPRSRFVVRFTPTHAGTFIYHAHGSNPWELAEGLFGALIVLNPGQTYDPQHEVLMVIGAANLGFGPKPVTINGSDTFPEMTLQHGVEYRVRVVNMAPSLETDITLGSAGNPVTWREIAKDGVPAPARLARPENAFVHIVSGETYDFALRVDQAGEIPVAVENWIYKTKVTGRIVVH